MADGQNDPIYEAKESVTGMSVAASSPPTHMPQLLFTEDEWNTAMPLVTAAMVDFIRPYRTPLFIDRESYGEGWGSGSFVEVGKNIYVLTNQHVADVRRSGDRLGVRFDGQDNLVVIMGDHVEANWPWDLALVPISPQAWTSVQHTAKTINPSQIAMAQTAVPYEIFAFSGYAGENTAFHFQTMLFGATTSLAREAELPADERWSDRFHFGLDYRPDLATSIVGTKGLPRPPGLSGSTVWSTNFVEARMSGREWSPELSKVVGVVWGWSSSLGLIVATRAEHVRSLVLEAL